MKKFVALIISAIMCCSLFSGCGNQSELDSLREENSSLRAKLENNSAKSDSYVESKLEESEESSSTFSQPETSEPAALSKYEKYVKENNIILDNYDVQYDMGNNLNTQFTLEGVAELSDYYNYGFDKDMEKDYFCVCVTPSNGKYSNRWYIYCYRTAFKPFFDDLKKGECNVLMVAYIPSKRYKSGQNNMAMLDYVTWGKKRS